MTISSRTPEGEPHRCPICGETSLTEPSFPGGDSCCEACGHLLWWVRDSLHRLEGVPREEITATSDLADVAFRDSLGVVEWVIEVEEEYELSIPEADFGKLSTVADSIRYIKSNISRFPRPK